MPSLLQKRVVIISLAVLGVAILLGIVIWFWLSLSQSSTPTPAPTQSGLELPSSNTSITNPETQIQSGDNSLPTQNNSQAPSPSTTTIPPVRATSPANNLAVTLDQTVSPNFSLSIKDVRITDQDSTIEYFAPKDTTSPFSVVRVIGTGNSILFEQSFTIASTLLAESPNSKQNPTQIRSSFSETYVLPMPSGALPVQIEILSSRGEIITQQPIDYTSLPTVSNTASTQPLTVSLWNQVSRFFSLNRFALAQTQAPAQVFRIVVINELGANNNINNAVSEANYMKNNIAPWSDFATKVSVDYVVNNSFPLGCGSPGNGYPSCSSGNAIAVVSDTYPDWDAIIIVTDVNCDCGTVAPGGPPVANVGKDASALLLVHELGHAVADMRDEYTNLIPSGQSLTPNCFVSQQACEDATKEYPGAQCSPSCLTSNSWRPASRIMYNTYSPLEFGPFEKCIMGKAIAKKIGETYSQCPEDDNTDPNPTPPPLGNYYGWHR